MISSAVSHPNKAIVIYWGNSDDRLNIPSRVSLSMTLQGIGRQLDYAVTLQTSEADRDRVFVDGAEDTGLIYSDFVRHLDAMREMTGYKGRLTVRTKTTFPVGSGLAGSAAASSALAMAFAGLLGNSLDRKLISALARRGSGSAARSVFGGFVKLVTGKGDSFAVQLYDETYWDLRDVIAVVDAGQKKVKSRDGMRLSVQTCPASTYSEFVKAADCHVREAEQAITKRNLRDLGSIYEFDNALFRRVCMETVPSLDYWTAGTELVFRTVAGLREEGVELFAGTDAGPNVHILCHPSDSQRVINALHNIPEVREIIHALPGGPSMCSEAHLQ